MSTKENVTPEIVEELPLLEVVAENEIVAEEVSVEPLEEVSEAEVPEEGDKHGRVKDLHSDRMVFETALAHDAYMDSLK